MPTLNDLYREIVLDHYRNPRNWGTLDCPPALQAKGFNPLCGDEVSVYVEVADDVLADVRVDGQGCSISQAAASMMSVSVKGRSVEEVKALERVFKSMMDIQPRKRDDVHTLESVGGDPSALGDLAALAGVKQFPVRIKCATLCWNTLAESLKEAAAG